MLIIISSFLPTLCQVVNDDVDDDNNDDVSRDAADESDDSSNMMVDESKLNSNPVNMQVDDPRPKGADEIEDGWVQVARRWSRGKGN